MTRYQARRLPSHRGVSGWDAILPRRVSGAKLDRDQTVDFTVIGGGFAGMAAARRLLQLAPGSKIAVLEAGRIAEGASGRNSGFMIDLPHELISDDYVGLGDDRAVIALNRQALAFSGGAVEEYGIDANYFDRAGKINGAASATADAYNFSYGAHLASLGESSERLDSRQMHEVTGSWHYRSGLYTSGTVMLQPAGFMRGMADGLRRSGVQIFEQSPVIGFEGEGSGWSVMTPLARLSSGRIVLTVNGHLESFGFARGRLMHIFLFATMTRELDVEALARLGGQNRWGITPSDPMGTTMRKIDSGQGGNRIVTRTCAVLRSGMLATGSDSRRAGKIMRDKFEGRFPQLLGMSMEHSWSGHLCLTMNGVSVMGEIARGIYSGCVQNGLGTVRGTLTGIGAAELACGVESEITRYFSGEGRPKRLLPRAVRDFGANAVLRWKERKARQE